MISPTIRAWKNGGKRVERAGLHIMGRKTYQGMAEYIPAADADHPYAKVMNSAPKGSSPAR